VTDTVALGRPLTCDDFPVIFWGMDRVAEELGTIGLTLAEIRDRMPLPDNRFMKFLKVFVLVAGAMGIFHVVDLIWSRLAGG